jgi:hypothetical protein
MMKTIESRRRRTRYGILMLGNHDYGIMATEQEDLNMETTEN